jgi:hypothetical protein
MEPIKILKAARVRIASPEAWGKGRRNYDRPIDSCCIAEAVEEAGAFPGLFYERKRAMRAVYDAAGLERGYDVITEWNDAPERTHDEVLKTLNLAIAILK